MKNSIAKILHSKWTYIVAGVLVLAIAGTVTAINWNNWFGGKEEETRNVSKEIFWNVDYGEYAYKSESFTSSRDVDKDDGMYHIMFANLTQQGRGVTRRCKDKSVVDKIDTMRAMGLVFDSKNLIVDVIPVEEMGYKITTKCGYVENQSEDGSVITLNTSESLAGIQTELKVTPGTPIYDGCGITGAVGNVVEKLAENDCIYALSTEKGMLKYIILNDRVVTKNVYWNISRKWDSKKTASTREPDENGVYTFLLAVNGEQHEYKTKDIAIVKDIDGTAAKCFGLDIDEDGVTITKFYSAKKTTGGSSFGSWYNITQIDGNTITAVKEETGDTATGTMANNCKIYDVDSRKGHLIGEYSTIQVGDQIHGLKNAKDKICHIFIVTKLPKIVKTAYCPHCKQTVPWYEYSGSGAKDGYHYIVTEDKSELAQFSIGSVPTTANKDKDVLGKVKYLDVVLDLNGHKLSSAKRNIAVGIGSKLTLMDTKGGGVITCGNKNMTDTGIGVWVCNNATFNMMSGTIDVSGTTNFGNGSSVYLAAGATFNMTGGTIQNGKSIRGEYISSGATKTGGGYGGNVYLSGKSTYTHSTSGEKKVYGPSVFNMSGGTITGGLAKPDDKFMATVGVSGGNIYISKDTQFNMTGGTVSNGTAYGMGGNIRSDNGIITISGGTVIGGKAVYRDTVTAEGKPSKSDGHGGNIISNNIVYIKGGTIAEGIATNIGGGNLSMNNTNSKLIMTGGTIRDGWGPVKYRGNVYVWNTAGSTKNANERMATVDMSGGLITDTKSAPDGYYGGGVTFATKTPTEKDGVYTYYNSTIKLSGSASIVDNQGTNLYLPSGKYAIVDNYSGRTSVTAPDGKFALDAAQYASCFTGDDEGVDCGVVGNDLWLGTNRYCTVHGQVELFQKYTSGAIVNNGHYFLYKDTELKKQINIGNSSNTETSYVSVDVTFDLNGKKLINTADKASSTRVFAVQMGCNLNVLDTDGNGNQTGSGVIGTKFDDISEAQGAGIWVRNRGNCNFFGGTIDMTGLKASLNPGTSVCVQARASFNQYAGTIMGGTTQNKSGGGNVITYGTYTLYPGAVITGGKALGAPNTYVNKDDGKTYDFSEGAYGGNVCVSTNGVFNQLGGTISDGFVQTTGDYREAGGGNIFVGEKGTYNQTAGTVTGGRASNGGNISVAEYKTTFVNISGGTIENGSAYKLVNDGKVPSGESNTNGWGGRGGNIITYATVNLSNNAEIKNGYADANGGNVALRKAPSVFNMSGGLITGGQCAGQKISSNMYIYDNDTTTLNMTGGQIDGYVYLAKGILNVSGTAVISGIESSDKNVSLNTDKYITIAAPLTDGANIKVSATGIFAKGVETVKADDYKSFFKADNGEEVKCLTAENELYVGHVHCLCNNTVAAATKENGHEHEYIGWTEIPAGTSASKVKDKLVAGGNYYLGGDFTLNAQVTIAAGKTLNLCLNGHTLSNSTDPLKRVFSVNNDNTTLNICDCDTEGKGTVKFTGQIEDKGVICFGNGDNSSFNLYSGVLDASEGEIIFGSSQKATSETGGAIYGKYTMNVYGGTIKGVKGGSGSVFYNHGSTKAINIYGGKLIGNTVEGTAEKINGKGGVIYAKCNLNIYDGAEIIAGSATRGAASFKDTGSGGAIYYDGGENTFNLYGGIIDGGDKETVNAYNGGNFYIYSGNFNMTGGTVQNGTSSIQGGNMRLGGNVKLSGGTIKDGTATKSEGGNIFCIGATAKIEITGEVLITGGTTAKNGGNICIYKNTTVDMTGGTVQNGTVTGSGNCGGNVYVGSSSGDATFNVSGGLITGGKADKGAGVYVAFGTVNLSGTAQIKGNTGTNLYLVGEQVAVGTLDNTASIGISMNEAGQFSSTGSEFINNFFSDNNGLSIVKSGADGLALQTK